MNNKFFINCDEATAICNKNQYKEATFWEKLRLGIHIFICKKCRQFSRQNAIVTDVCNKHLRKDEAEYKLTENEKKVLQTEIVKKIK